MWRTKEMSIRFQVKKIWFALNRLFRKTYMANVCGHRTKKKDFMFDGHETTIMEMPLAENGNPDYCLVCIGAMSIQCAWCGKPITIGDPVTLYVPEKDFEVPVHAVRYHEGDGPEALVGCLRWNCADTGGDLCGTWLPPGQVHRVPSPIELCLASCEEGRQSMVIVGDTHNYPGSVSVHPID